MSQKRILQIIFALLTIVTVLHLLHYYLHISLPEILLVGSRWITWLFVILFAVQKKSLTTWILVSMIVGVEIGLNFPDFAQNLSVLSKIFLRLIKTIIAPILFSTLVVGIAGHSDLKQVGRMGWKSILYFEIVTTVALMIGIIAINITKAG
ncbi:MAG TPA: cation:dicarboxylase symporter family transporter, partial [Chryseolinea sp.]|nr:cation:dicarboxylase symporter family transporter [Chryseolinea sp.]